MKRNKKIIIATLLSAATVAAVSCRKNDTPTDSTQSESSGSEESKKSEESSSESKNPSSDSSQGSTPSSSTPVDPVKTYTVTFNSNGGSSISSLSINEGSLIAKPEDPVKDNYNFNGWYSDENCTTIFDFATKVNSNITLYAKWTEKSTPVVTYTVTFSTDGGSSVSSQTVKENSQATKPSNPTKEGYTFEGWYTDSSCQNEYNFASTVTSNLTLYAKWALVVTPVNNYTVTFESNGGSVVDNETVKEGSQVSKPSDPTKDGMRFDGWYTTSSLSEEYNFNDKVTSNLTLYAKWINYTPRVTFVGTSYDYVEVQKGSTVTKPADPTKTGYEFEGWYADSLYTTKFDFNTIINEDTNIYAHFTKQSEGSGSITTEGSVKIISATGANESAYITFNKYNDITEYDYYIGGKKLSEKEVYTQSTGTNTYRADFFGLSKGNYEISVVPHDESGSVSASIAEVSVIEYDRSGYAHFGYSDGVGAYNDDGTLKENAIVLYVTDETKNTVTLTYGDITVTGIGNILNTVGQECNEAGHEGECKKVSSGKTYYGKANGNKGILKILADNNIPLVIRMVGTISESGLYKQGTYDAKDDGKIDGLTAYNGVDYGGSEGDNGHMARMKSAKDITIEGVGDNACLDGWGVHFMADSASPNNGKSFEVRNLAFMNTPEDAIGMEGIQEGTKITAPVERVWIHHNTFLAPSISSPAESDKAQGDGSCDFKRGQYFTMSYNYFEYCHKTNLVGSSDSSLQYNISMHHNIWYNCGSRIPLLRQANVHFYNNYIYGDSTDSESALSYVHSLRANCYLYSENNFYEGCKNPVTDGASGTACKLYGNTFVQCFGDQVGTVVTDREAKVSSSCAYNGVSYANFDTNSSLFYYNSETKQSDCYLTTAAEAREEVIKYAGSNYRTVLNQTTLKTTSSQFNEVTPQNSVEVPTSGSISITLPTSKGSQTSDNVEFTNITGVSSGTIKFRGKAITFRLDKYATITLEGAGSSTQALSPISIVKSDNTLIASDYGSYVLAPGTYVITSCQKDKDSTLSSLTFTYYNAEEFKAELIKTYNDLFAAIGTVDYSETSYEKIRKAISAYEALGDYKDEVSTNPYDKKNEYVQLGVVYVESLISAIGTVGEYSSPQIQAARSAYNQLRTIDSTVEISNIDTLISAENEYKSYAITGCINLINDIGTVTIDSKEAIEAAEAAFDALDGSQQKSVTNYSVLQKARSTYNNIVALDNFKTLIDAIDLTTDPIDELSNLLNAYSSLSTDNKETIDTTYSAKLSQIRVLYCEKLIDAIPTTIDLASNASIQAARAQYDSLTDSEKTSVSNYSTLTNAESAYTELASQTHIITFENGATDSTGFFTFSGKSNTKKETVTANGKTYTQTLKMESTTTITATLAKESTVTIVSAASSKKIIINGETYTIGTDGTVSVKVSAGTLTITKGDSLNVCEIDVI